MTLLDELKSKYIEIAPRYSKILPATQEQIEQIESFVEAKLPEEYKDFLLNNDIAFVLRGNFTILSAEEVLSDARNMNNSLENGVFDDGRFDLIMGNWGGDFMKHVWWNKKWVPFAKDSMYNLYCIDLDPNANGTYGQLINMENQDAQGPFVMPEKSFINLLQEYLDTIKTGKFVFDE